MLTLYSVPVSTYAQKVRLAAALMGLELARWLWQQRLQADRAAGHGAGTGA